MLFAMEAAAKANIPYFVLDRPNPITGVRVEGPMLDSSHTSFVGYAAGEPVRHGMTVGELARFYNAERNLGANLTVIPLQDWNRSDWFDSTNLSWTNPSPNMRSLRPVAVTTMSAGSSWPDFSFTPVSVKHAISSVTTDALPARSAANSSLFGVRHRRCSHGL